MVTVKSISQGLHEFVGFSPSVQTARDVVKMLVKI